MSKEDNMEGTPEHELSIEEQTNLAQELSEANSNRNALLEQYPDWDDLIVFVNGSHENRKHYEELEKAANEAREKLNVNVADKSALVGHLRETGENELADEIAGMFGVK